MWWREILVIRSFCGYYYLLLLLVSLVYVPWYNKKNVLKVLGPFLLLFESWFTAYSSAIMNVHGEGNTGRSFITSGESNTISYTYFAKGGNVCTVEDICHRYTWHGDPSLSIIGLDDTLLCVVVRPIPSLCLMSGPATSVSATVMWWIGSKGAVLPSFSRPAGKHEKVRMIPRNHTSSSG